MGKSKISKVANPRSPKLAQPAPAAGRQWTPEQLLGIRTTGRSLLVSAAAGSGKTSVLAQRCAYLVCDAPTPCDMDELLVVTFTEAAAAEMKSRVAEALRERAGTTPSQRLDRQLALADQAQVSTLHSFCARLLRQHFHLVDLDPGFAVLEADEARLLRREVARTLFDTRYELDAVGDFHRFIDAYGEGNDDRVLRQVLHAHDLLTSVVDPPAWIARAHARIAEAAHGPLADSELGAELIDTISKGLAVVRQRCDQTIGQLRALGFPRYVEYLSAIAAMLGYWHQAFADDGIDALAEVVKDVEWPRLPTIRGDVANKELAKSLVESVREEAKSGIWRDRLRFSVTQWQDGLARILPHTEVFLKLVEDFDAAYQQAKRASRSVDFADLERYALRALRDADASNLAPSPAARAYHRRFAHVLVDEYQDINQVQDAILTLVSRECVAQEYGTVPNFFCVGDVKQSIYRFRLAEPQRFLERQEQYRGGDGHGQVIDLQANFRSRDPLLEAINSVFARLMTADAADIEYDQTQRLHGQAGYPPADGPGFFPGAPIDLHLLPQTLPGRDEHSVEDSEDDDQDIDRTGREAILVAQEIRMLLGRDGAAPMQVMERGTAGVMTPRPIQPRDIVILLRSLKFKSDQFAQVLRGFDIPVHTDSGSGFFQSTEIRDMLALLALLDNRRQDIPLAAVLRSPLGQLHDAETCLAKIRLAYPSESVPFHEATIRYAAEKTKDALAAQLNVFFTQLAHWRDAAQRRPLAEVIWSIYHQTGYLAFVAGLRNGDQRVANLMHLYERAGQFGRFHERGLSRFLRFLEQLDEESDLAQPPLASQADDVVRIMSIHRSKGLEFPVVIVPDLGKAINMQDCRGAILLDRSAGLGMAVVDEEKHCRYPSLAQTLVQSRLRQQSLAEELRVLYVAMTRAREHLILVGTCEEKAAEKWESRWRGHAGPLPADAVLGVRSMLDWIGPVSVAARTEPHEVIRTIQHSPEEVAAWKSPAEAHEKFSPEQAAMARLEPLPENPESSDAANRAIERIAFEYPYRAFSQLPGSQSVTVRHKAPLAWLPADGSQRNPGSTGVMLAQPKFLLEGPVHSAADRGTATHIVLEHLNFAGPCDRDDVTREIARMVTGRLMTPAQAAMVDMDAIVWLMQSEAGDLLRGGGGSVRREIPVNFPAETTSPPPDPLDRTMIRGRLDVLITGPTGATILDYKTDDISKSAVPSRAASYRPQLEAYRDAIQEITGMQVARIWLAFLTPRVLFPLER
ncbi:MAG: ATP-dependent deoxyribonuclease subunit [Phycisphaerales bacterium]|nr:ATP-dependent deoxyribonuclease subunit [Phycisphaerales bacterium]